MADTEELVVRESLRGHLRVLVLSGVGLVAAVVLSIVLGGTWVLVYWLGGLVVLGGLGVRAARRGDWVLRVDADGMHWRDGRSLPWPGIAEIRVGKPANDPAGRPFPGGGALTVVTTAQADFARRAGTRPDGRVIPAHNLTASPDEIIAAVRRHSPVPVVRAGRIQQSDRNRT